MGVKNFNKKYLEALLEHFENERHTEKEMIDFMINREIVSEVELEKKYLKMGIVIF